MTQPTPSHLQHKRAGPKTVTAWILTVSDSRMPETDESGSLLKQLFEEQGHTVAGSGIVKDDPQAIQQALDDALAHPDVQVLVVNGGTGISRRDGTCEIVQKALQKTLDGFGEIFRFLSYQDIGSAAIMSRTVAGVAKGKIVISLPGSPRACRLAMEKLILPEVGHMVFELNR